jgi:hypothetical protein
VCCLPPPSIPLLCLILSPFSLHFSLFSLLLFSLSFSLLLPLTPLCLPLSPLPSSSHPLSPIFPVLHLTKKGNHEYYNTPRATEIYTMEQVDQKISEICSNFENVTFAKRFSEKFGNFRGKFVVSHVPPNHSYSPSCLSSLFPCPLASLSCLLSSPPPPLYPPLHLPTFLTPQTFTITI